jgi:hypothetical protein
LPRTENQEETVAGPLRQTRDMLCAFKPGDGSPEETYTGTFQSVGRDQKGIRQLGDDLAG